MPERVGSSSVKIVPAGYVFSLRFQSYDSMVGHGENEHFEVEEPLAARSIRGAINEARGKWNTVASRAWIEMETAWASPDGRGRASEYWHAVVYPHSPKLGHSMDLQSQAGFAEPDPTGFLERLRAFQEKPEAVRHRGLLEGYEDQVKAGVNGEYFSRIWPAVRRITRLTENQIAVVNGRIYFGQDQVDLRERITHEPNHESAFFARVGGIKR